MPIITDGLKNTGPTLAHSRATLAFLLLVFLPCQIFAAEPRSSSPIDSLFDPTFIGSLSWNADNKIEEVVHTWPSYSGRQGFDNKLVRRQGEVEILGTKFEAEYRVYKETDKAEVTFIAPLKAQPGPFCLKFREWIQTKLGKPAVFIDTSILPPGKFIAIEADWLFNAAIVEMSCDESPVVDNVYIGLVTVRYSHKDHLEPLKALIPIECIGSKRTHTINGDTHARLVTDPPIKWIIDPNGKRLLRPDRSSFGKTESYSDEMIAVSKEGDDIKIEVRIDRVTGNYLLKMDRTKESARGFEEWGRCSRIEQAQKF